MLVKKSQQILLYFNTQLTPLLNNLDPFLLVGKLEHLLLLWYSNSYKKSEFEQKSIFLGFLNDEF